MTFVTFIVPTIGRHSLVRAINSVTGQTDPDWQCFVEGDGVDPRPILGDVRDPIHAWHQKRRYHESDMRNIGIRQARSEWVAFLDDDDTIAPDYVKWLKEESRSYDVVIFRQTHPKSGDKDDTIFPSTPEIVWGNVGISYAVRREWALKFPFKRTRHEDLLQLVALEAGGADIHFSSHIAYYGRDHRG